MLKTDLMSARGTLNCRGLLEALKHAAVGAALVTFFSFCRSGKITVEKEKQYDPKTHLSFEDVTVDNAASPSVISLNIKYSKTDQGRVEVRVILGRTGDDLCPIGALLNYLSRRGSKRGPLFHWQDGTPLSKDKICGGNPSSPHSSTATCLRLCRA